jgi:hypothetical protein
VLSKTAAYVALSLQCCMLYPGHFTPTSSLPCVCCGACSVWGASHQQQQLQQSPGGAALALTASRALLLLMTAARCCPTTWVRHGQEASLAQLWCSCRLICLPEPMASTCQRPSNASAVHAMRHPFMQCVTRSCDASTHA